VAVSRRRFIQLVALFLVGGRASAQQRTIELICRDAWGARKPSGGFKRHAIKRITVHHSASKLTDNRDAPAHFRAHQRAHQARGWPDIAYHLLIDRRGNVYEGRRIRAVGDTATDYDPRGHLLVMCEGHFGEQRPSAAQVDALVDVLAWAVDRYEVPAGTIRGHLDYASTACPGRALYRRLRQVRRLVRDRLASGRVSLVELCGAAGSDRVADIEAGRA
jgi:hypothetical protein